ncbi:hypothetical protein BH24DEI2_BH24DEI2_24320 [soil metagenome]
MKKVGLRLMGLCLAVSLGTGLASVGKPGTAPTAGETAKTPVEAGAEAAGEADGVTRGLEVYRTQYCGTCHTLKAAGTLGIFGPPHDAIGVIAGARIQDPHYHGEAKTAEAYLIESILNPRVYLVPGYSFTYHHMPAYTALSETDLDALVTMLLAQTGVRQ